MLFAGPRQDQAIYEQVQASAERFAVDVIRPSASDREERFPDEIYQEMADEGGAGLDMLAYAVVMEAVSGTIWNSFIPCRA